MIEEAARIARERGPSWLRDVLAAHKVVRLSEISRSDLKNLLHTGVACAYTTPPLRRTYPVKLTIEVTDAADAAIAARVCEFFAAQGVAGQATADRAADRAADAPVEATRTRKPRAAKPDPVEQYNALAGVAGAATVEPTPLEQAIAEAGAKQAVVDTTAEAVAAAETAIESAAPNVSPPATDTRTDEEIRAALLPAIKDKGILWVREHVIDVYKTVKLSELTREQLLEVEGKLS